MPEPNAHRSPGNATVMPEWSFLVSLCRQTKNVEQLHELLIRGLDWDRFLFLADEHGVTVQVARESREFASAIPAAIQQQLYERTRGQAVVALGITAEMFRLLSCFRDSGIEVFVIKGPVLAARAYGDPDARQYGDLDLLLRSRDIQHATEAMQAAGYKASVPLAAIKNRKIPGEYVFRDPSGQTLVELHTEQSLRSFPKPLPIDQYFARKTFVEIDERSIPAMSSEDEFVHTCVHGTKHLWERLKWIADVGALLNRREGLDWKMVAASAERVGAHRMVSLGVLLASEILGAKIPAELQRDILKDRALHRFARSITERLPYAGEQPAGLLQRAAYRVAMCGGGISGVAYLWKLSTSPTEKDWAPQDRSQPGSAGDTLRRIFRLAKLYGRSRN